MCNLGTNISKDRYGVDDATKAGVQPMNDVCPTNIKSDMRSFKSNDNIHKKEGGSYYVVSANKASSVTL